MFRTIGKGSKICHIHERANSAIYKYRGHNEGHKQPEDAYYKIQVALPRHPTHAHFTM